MRSRGARGTRAANTSTSGQVISRVRPSVKATRGRVAWKSKNSSGSIVAKRVAFSDAPTNCSAAEAASPASFQPLKAQTRAGARNPSGRLSHRRGCIRVTVQDGRVAIAALQAGQQVDAVFACTRKDRLVTRTGTPYLALELRDRTGTVAAARVPRRRRPRRPLRPRRPRARARARGPLPRRAADRGRGDRPRRRRPTPTRPRSCRPPTGTSTSSTASSSTSPARCATPASAGCSTGSSATRCCAPGLRRSPCTRGGHHAYLGGLLEHTVAVATLAQETCIAARPARRRPAADRGDRARPRQDAGVHVHGATSA